MEKSLLVGSFAALAMIFTFNMGCAAQGDGSDEDAAGEADVTSDQEALGSQSCGGACRRIGFTCGGVMRSAGRTADRPGRTVCLCNYHNGSGKPCTNG